MHSQAGHGAPVASTKTAFKKVVLDAVSLENFHHSLTGARKFTVIFRKPFFLASLQKTSNTIIFRGTSSSHL